MPWFILLIMVHKRRRKGEDMAVTPTAQTEGKDFNYFVEVSVSGTSAFPAAAQAFSKFRGARRMLFVCTTGSVTYSFNGRNVHGKMNSSDASSQLNFGPRQEDKVFFYGTGTVQVHMWQSNY